jgi:hypothetical protein
MKLVILKHLDDYEDAYGGREYALAKLNGNDIFDDINGLDGVSKRCESIWRLVS